MSKEFSNTNPNNMSLAEIRKEAYEQGRTERLIEVVSEEFVIGITSDEEYLKFNGHLYKKVANALGDKVKD